MFTKIPCFVSRSHPNGSSGRCPIGQRAVRKPKRIEFDPGLGQCEPESVNAFLRNAR